MMTLGRERARTVMSGEPSGGGQLQIINLERERGRKFREMNFRERIFREVVFR